MFDWGLRGSKSEFLFMAFKIRDAYKTYMKKVAKLLGGGPDSDEQMMKVFELETKLATVSRVVCKTGS